MINVISDFNAQVWLVNGKEKTLIPSSDQSKFYSGSCYIFQYTYAGEDEEEYLVGTWSGKKSIEVNISRNLMSLFSCKYDLKNFHFNMLCGS